MRELLIQQMSEIDHNYNSIRCTIATLLNMGKIDLERDWVVEFLMERENWNQINEKKRKIYALLIQDRYLDEEKTLRFLQVKNRQLKEVLEKFHVDYIDAYMDILNDFYRDILIITTRKQTKLARFVRLSKYSIIEINI